ncbi:putative quinol monooxygenase [Kribbella sp. VKM Ac-2566]|uniref:putative quinol monooxygenase n=1 Tax=Kribbella sp. VKM Ac-2566 TaxID=2512218 RepID=UPI0010644603|nr:antibiotic biosynthesis monooxygenase [Kribbella sp. VKM Ac-2566]TDX08266.1 quinol monooxygenase YgiN [Kribbella sp. VKM Ac-2566]
MVALVAHLTASEGNAKRLEELLRLLVERSREENGVLQYTAHRDCDDESSFWMYEVYADDEALAAHRARKPLEALGSAFHEAIATPPSITLLTPLASR